MRLHLDLLLEALLLYAAFELCEIVDRLVLGQGGREEEEEQWQRARHWVVGERSAALHVVAHVPRDVLHWQPRCYTSRAATGSRA